MEFFTIKELSYSQTAINKKIKNEPNEQEIKNLTRLVDLVLDPFRREYKKPINITSGFRSPELNTAIGGSATSAHMTGNAVDMQPANGDFEYFKYSFLLFLEKNKIKYDQCIIEKNSRGIEWIHFGLYNNKGEQRMQSFTLNPK